jgi:hypothetical protein
MQPYLAGHRASVVDSFRDRFFAAPNIPMVQPSNSPSREGDVDAQAWDAVEKAVAIFAGVAFGSVAISSASWVWLRKQKFAAGGSVLCLSGIVSDCRSGGVSRLRSAQ